MGFLSSKVFLIVREEEKEQMDKEGDREVAKIRRDE
jgi:hypothetical protein